VLAGTLVGLIVGGSLIRGTWNEELFTRVGPWTLLGAAIVMAVIAAVISNVLPRVVGAAALVLSVCCAVAAIVALIRGQVAFTLALAATVVVFAGPQITAREVLRRGGAA
jgi:hypothetical protein